MIPAEPFLPWWIAFVNRNKRFFQREHERTEAGISVSGPSPRVATEAITIVKQFDREAFSVYCGIEPKEYSTLLSYYNRGCPTVNLGLVDRILTALGRPDLLDLWYPWDFFDEAGRWRGYPVLGEQEG